MSRRALPAVRAATIALPLALAATLALPAAAGAQESVFNVAGFGVPSSGESMAARGTGGSEVGPHGEIFSLENPARMARFGRAGIYLSLLGQTTEAEGAGGSGDFSDVVFPAAQIVFPAWREAGLGIGYGQVVDFDARIATRTTFEGDSVDVTLESEGALAMVSPGFGLPVGRRTAVGVTLDFYLGSRDLIQTVELAGESPGAVTAADTLGWRFRGVGAAFGIDQALGERLRVGAAWRFRPTIDTEITRSSADEVGREVEFDLPSELVVDVAGQLSNSLFAGVAARWSPWSELSGEGIDPELQEDLVEIGGGLEWRPENRTALLLGANAPLRLGARWRRLPVVAAGESVTEWSLSVGHGRAFSGWSRVDATFEMGRRGALEENGLSERFMRLGVAVAAFEQWQRVD